MHFSKQLRIYVFILFMMLSVVPTFANTSKPNIIFIFYGKWHLPGNPGENEFDDHYVSRNNPSGGGGKDPKFIFDLTNKGLSFMWTQVQAGKPFYIQLSHFAVHLPIQYRSNTPTKYQQRPTQIF